MTLNDRRELPTEHKEREEQTNDNNLDNCVHHLAGPQVVTYLIEIKALGPPAPISTLIVQREGQQHLLVFNHREKKESHSSIYRTITSTDI